VQTNGKAAGTNIVIAVTAVMSSGAASRAKAALSATAIRVMEMAVNAAGAIAADIVAQVIRIVSSTRLHHGGTVA
ncbi:MAG: hypothetical protein JNN17_12160, partial [Verrucomicrobiaceae bacterium]|nr:hypothetical protein [Verrucomicrobiaceae bacterium]